MTELQDPQGQRGTPSRRAPGSGAPRTPSARSRPAPNSPMASALSWKSSVRLRELAADDRVLLLGEDVSNAGGVFKTNEGLVEKHGLERIRNTPICENGFVGVALGMAVTGMRPIVEIMFSDFLPTAGDAIVNELPKFRFMSGGQTAVPVTVRSIGGATGRFGTQHSATGESWYMALPGLRIAVGGTPQSAYSLLRAAIRLDDPVIFFEHKGLYARKGPVRRGEIAELGKAEILRSGGDLTIVATLLMLQRAARISAAADARDYVVPDDVKELAIPVLAHRVITTPEAQLSGVTSVEIVEDVVEQTPVPKRSKG
jgi:acetoin:2,6-dichlorophenolindophenol oxidoreductase subunit beta